MPFSSNSPFFFTTSAACGLKIGLVKSPTTLWIMLPSGLRSLLTIGPGPDDGGSKLNQRPHMPDRSGMDVAFSAPLLAGGSGGIPACPKTGVAAAAASVATKRKSRCCKFMLSSLFLSSSGSSRIKLNTLRAHLEGSVMSAPVQAHRMTDAERPFLPLRAGQSGRQGREQQKIHP